jgi:hydrogenase-1 operon protein HyaF
MSLLGEDPDTMVEINELLGQGEVSVLIDGGRQIRVQESAFAGVWRIQASREDGSLVMDEIEAGAMPRIVAQSLAAQAGQVPVAVTPPANLMNAPALMNELHDQSARYRPGKAAHVVNLTLLPVTAEDLEYIGECLGRGNVSILSRGYGNCRITATALPHTWWVQYFNSMDQLILNTLEVGDVPDVALAAKEDYEDSIERLREWIITLEDV